MDGVRVLTSPEPSCPPRRGPRLQRVHCSVVAAILGSGSRKVVGGSFPGDLCSRVGRRGSYLCCIFSDRFSSIFKTSGRVIMAGFELWAWIVARGCCTTPHSLMFCFVLVLSPLVAKVSEPLAPFNEWCGGPHLHGTFVSSQPRLQRVHCSVAAAILGRGSREVVGGSFPGKLCPKVDRRGLYLCCIFSDHFSSVFKAPGRRYGRI
ncbi:hypothetical protein NDU88_001392 [Pleurodeles waltl]|uniref:Uncharacterized protein n=1 Tax=Pleurodeles waltl TaxID=8319 RepID=A0AAV7RBH1_PLEWA|nr:hypothetical protein NDU88_001392 [Pleurodeles waltl]